MRNAIVLTLQAIAVAAIIGAFIVLAGMCCERRSPPKCRAGSIESVLTNCEIMQ